LPQAVPYYEHQQRQVMTATYQTDITYRSYNGWSNYETWNVALWINNDEGLYHTALECGDYQTFVEMFGEETSTPDGVCYGDPKVNVVELNSEIFDL